MKSARMYRKYCFVPSFYMGFSVAALNLLGTLCIPLIFTS